MNSNESKAQPTTLTVHKRASANQNNHYTLEQDAPDSEEKEVHEIDAENEYLT